MQQRQEEVDREDQADQVDQGPGAIAEAVAGRLEDGHRDGRFGDVCENRFRDGERSVHIGHDVVALPGFTGDHDLIGIGPGRFIVCSAADRVFDLESVKYSRYAGGELRILCSFDFADAVRPYRDRCRSDTQEDVYGDRCIACQGGTHHDLLLAHIGDGGSRIHPGHTTVGAVLYCRSGGKQIHPHRHGMGLSVIYAFIAFCDQLEHGDRRDGKVPGNDRDCIVVCMGGGQPGCVHRGREHAGIGPCGFISAYADDGDILADQDAVRGDQAVRLYGENRIRLSCCFLCVVYCDHQRGRRHFEGGLCCGRAVYAVGGFDQHVHFPGVADDRLGLRPGHAAVRAVAEGGSGRIVG